MELILKISIHTFRVEGDLKSTGLCYPAIYFNPHLPCGRRQDRGLEPSGKVQFQSTPSVWKVTTIFDSVSEKYKISIHAFRAEGDRSGF